jgi:DNA-binding CsgD family transcriptional regulator
LSTFREIVDKPVRPSDLGQPNPLAWAMSAEAAALYQHVLTTPDYVVDPTDPTVHELIATRFADLAWGDPTRLIALPPDIAISRALANRTRLWLRSAPDVDAAQKAIDHYHQVTPIISVPVSEGGLETSEARQHASTTLATSARLEVCLMQPYPSWMPEQVRDDPQASTGAEPDALIRGVTYRYLYDERILADPQFRKLALEEIDLGVHARVTNSLPTWMMIVDATSAVYLPDPVHSHGTITRAVGLVTLLQLSFESAWTAARPLDVTRSADNLTDKHREVLLLAIAGNTNETIARQLNINIKTVRRRLDELCEHFGASDRAALLTTASISLN